MGKTVLRRALGKSVAKSIGAYYATLKEFASQHALHEGAVSVAFQTLLADVARSHHWTLIPQLSDKAAAGKSIRPDGTLKDPLGLVRGHWEAKDTSDRLDDEIAKKIAIGYPLDARAGRSIFIMAMTLLQLQRYMCLALSKIDKWNILPQA